MMIVVLNWKVHLAIQVTVVWILTPIITVLDLCLLFLKMRRNNVNIIKEKIDNALRRRNVPSQKSATKGG